MKFVEEGSGVETPDFKIISLSVLLRLDCMESRTEGWRSFQRLLQYFRQEKIVAWTKEIKEEVVRRGHS